MGAFVSYHHIALSWSAKASLGIIFVYFNHVNQREYHDQFEENIKHNAKDL